MPHLPTVAPPVVAGRGGHIGKRGAGVGPGPVVNQAEQPGGIEVPVNTLLLVERGWLGRVECLNSCGCSQSRTRPHPNTHNLRAPPLPTWSMLAKRAAKLFSSPLRARSPSITSSCSTRVLSRAPLARATVAVMSGKLAKRLKSCHKVETVVVGVGGGSAHTRTGMHGMHTELLSRVHDCNEPMPTRCPSYPPNICHPPTPPGCCPCQTMPGSFAPWPQPHRSQTRGSSGRRGRRCL